MTEAERTITTPDTPDDPAAEDSQGPAGDPASDASGATGDPASGTASAPATGGSDAVSPPVTDPGADASDLPDPAAGPARGRRRVAVLIGVAALAYALDLLSKIWVVHSLEHHDAVDVFGHYLRLDAIRNAGAAFGFGQGMTIVFTVIAVGVIVVIARLSRRLYSVPWAIALGLLLGGAFGNLTDRVFRAPGGFQGRVVDFIAPEHFAVFNLADSAICVGGALIVLLSFRGVDPDGTRHQD